MTSSPMARLRAPSRLTPRSRSLSMAVLGWRCRSARVLGNSQGLSVLAPVRTFGRRAMWSRRSCANGSGTSVGRCPRGDGHALGLVVDNVGLKCDDLDEGLGVEKQQYARDPVGKGHAGPLRSSLIQASR